MGQGIAQCAAMVGIDVLLFDVRKGAAAEAVTTTQWSLDKLHAKGKLEEHPPAVLQRIKPIDALAAAAKVDVVIEVVPERLDIKQAFFAEIDALCPTAQLLGSNTSAIPITQIAQATTRPDRVCGLHFFAPAAIMPLVEIIRGQHTSPQTIAAAIELAEAMGKASVVVQRDDAGFIVNRVLIAAIFEAVRLLERGVASAADIDRVMQLGCSWKMGPLATCDLSGLDVILDAGQAIFDASGDAAFDPPALLSDHVSAGNLGRKSGKGFFDHPSSS